jgi:hypothetical protein
MDKFFPQSLCEIKIFEEKMKKDHSGSMFTLDTLLKEKSSSDFNKI